MFNFIRWIYRRVHIIVLLFLDSFFEVVKSISADDGEWTFWADSHSHTPKVFACSSIRISLINWIWHDAHYFMRFINFLINRCQDVTTSIRLTSVYMSMKLHKISLLCAKCWIELHLIISTPSLSVEKNSNCISKCFQRIPIGWKNVRRSGRTRSLLTTFTDHSRGLIWSNH